MNLACPTRNEGSLETTLAVPLTGENDGTIYPHLKMCTTTDWAVQEMGTSQAGTSNGYWPGCTSNEYWPGCSKKCVLAGPGRYKKWYWPGWYKNWGLAGLGQEMDIDRAGTGNVCNTIIYIFQVDIDLPPSASFKDKVTATIRLVISS